MKEENGENGETQGSTPTEQQNYIAGLTISEVVTDFAETKKLEMMVCGAFASDLLELSRWFRHNEKNIPNSVRDTLRRLIIRGSK